MSRAEIIALAYERMANTIHHQTRWTIKDAYSSAGKILDDFLEVARELPGLEIRRTGHIFDRTEGIYRSDLEIPFKTMIKDLGDEEGILRSVDESLKTCAGWIAYMITHPLKAIEYKKLWKK